MVLDAAVFFSKVNFREIKSKCFMVQVTQDSFTYSVLHIDLVVLQYSLCFSLQSDLATD